MVRHLGLLAEYGILSTNWTACKIRRRRRCGSLGQGRYSSVGRAGYSRSAGRTSLATDHLRLLLEEPTTVASGNHWVGYGAPILRTVADINDPFAPKASTYPNPEMIGKGILRRNQHPRNFRKTSGTAGARLADPARRTSAGLGFCFSLAARHLVHYCAWWPPYAT